MNTETHNTETDQPKTTEEPQVFCFIGDSKIFTADGKLNAVNTSLYEKIYRREESQFLERGLAWSP